VNPLEAAIAYGKHGWRVFPVRPRAKQPATGNGFKDATTNTEQIRRWWTHAPDANIGLAPGPSGLLVVDIDCPAAESLARALGLLDEPTLTVETGRTDFPGRHLYFQHPGEHISQLRLALERAQVATVAGDRPGLEIKADAGYVLLPPSVHPSGRIYRWIRDEIRPLPPAAIEAFRAAAPLAGLRPTLPDEIGEGCRDSTLTSLAGALRRRGASEAVILTALTAINTAHCDPPLPGRDIERIARSVSRYQPAESAAGRYSEAVR
jgi:hypothetical protein